MDFRARAREIVVIHMYYAIRIAMLIALAAAAALAVELARADSEFRRGTPESVQRAIELAPGNAEYLLFRALQIDYDGGDASSMLERAAKLNPFELGAAHPAGARRRNSRRQRELGKMAARRGARRPSVRAGLDARQLLFSARKNARVLEMDARGAGRILWRPEAGGSTYAGA